MAKKSASRQKRRIYIRFGLVERIEHLLMLLSFTTLAVTGLPQKFPTNSVSVFFVRLLGGIETVRKIHHIAATVLMLVVIFYILRAGNLMFVRRIRLKILPSLKDIKDGWQALMYNLGLRKSRPQMDRYTFEEKLEYWSLVWGIVIMGVTGFMMWNPVATARWLPGEFIPAAMAAHGAEAILAVLAIIVWHMYAVHLKRFNKSMWTGRLTEDEMLEEHPLELADIKAGVDTVRVDPATLRKRQRLYYPIAGLLAVVMLAGVYGFVNGEKTAITTVPPQPIQVTVYAPLTPTPFPPTPTPTPTQIPTATATASGEVTAAAAGEPSATAITWDGYAGPLFAQKCTSCHGASQALNGLNLSTYADAMKGGQDGPVILPGDTQNSKLYQIQSAGGHFGQLTPDELAQIADWISQGAVEK
jgi:cytochrome b subunit of formate dehydrogenase/mono/diheme cytochrome c family protein